MPLPPHIRMEIHPIYSDPSMVLDKSVEEHCQQLKIFPIFISPTLWICKPKDIASKNAQPKLLQVIGHTPVEQLLSTYSPLLMEQFQEHLLIQIKLDMNLNSQ